MLQTKMRKLNIIVISILLMCSSVWASTHALVQKYVDKATTEYENGNTDDAFQYVNQAMALTKKDGIPPNVLYLAQTVYVKKLDAIKKSHDYQSLIDVQFGCEQYPEVQNTAVNKLLAQIKEQQASEADKKRDAQLAQQRQDEQSRFEQQQKTTSEQFKQQQEQYQKQQDLLRQQQESSQKNQQEIIN